MQVEVPVGTTFATDYRIERELGRGGMGVVYVATQLSTGRKRALKLMHPALIRNDEMRRRFEQEARVGSQIKSEHVVEVVAAGIEPGSGMPWIAMELLEGEDLESYVSRCGRLGLDETVRILAQICHALAAAHAAGVVHRDLKPENVFLMRARREDADLTVKLLDLGIAKIVAEARPSDTAAIGTPLWMAPEQAGGKLTAAADVWSLGLLVFFMLTGRSYWLTGNAPPQEQSVMGVLREVMVEPLEPASQRMERLGLELVPFEGFDQWFSKCVSRDPEQRYPNASAARAGFDQARLGTAATAPLPALLDSIAGSEPRSPAVAAQTAPARLPTRRRAWLGATALGALAIGAIVVLQLAAAAPRAEPVASSASAAPSTAPPSEPAPAPAPAPSPRALAPGEQAVDQSDSTSIWKIPVGDSPIRGPKDAPVTIVEFANFQCPFSKAVQRELRKILDEHPTSVRLVWKDDPLAIHSQAEAAAQVAREARRKLGDAGFWKAHDLLLDKQLRPTRAALIDVAKKVGLDPVEVAAVIARREHLEVIERDADLADDFAALGTPYFFVNGRRIAATMSLDQLRTAIDQELEKTAALEKQGVPRAAIYDQITAAGRGALPFETRKLDWYSPLLPTRGGREGMVAALVEFCDYTHFMCRLVEPTIDELLRDFDGKLVVSWTDVPREGELGRMAALAGRVAWTEMGEPGFDKMRRLLLDGQKQGLNKRSISRFAELVGFERAHFTSAIEEPRLNGDVDRMTVQAKKQSIDVPGFLICGPDFCLKGGYYLTGGHPRRAFEKRIRLIIDSGGALPGR
jgi:protein-disulfide isomerase/tRNA A-37 threonylcarbamoyl transferase component Bud32